MLVKTGETKRKEGRKEESLALLQNLSYPKCLASTRAANRTVRSLEQRSIFGQIVVRSRKQPARSAVTGPILEPQKSPTRQSVSPVHIRDSSARFLDALDGRTDGRRSR